MTLHVISLVDLKEDNKGSNHLGDDNNARGVAAALIQKKVADGIKVVSREVNINSVAAMGSLASLEKNGDQYVIVGAGKQCLEPLARVKQGAGGQNVRTAWSGHQYFPELEDVHASLDSIALPGHVIATDPKAKTIKHTTKRKFVETVGVPHNVTIDSLKPAATEWDDRIPGAKKYLLVILGGDAPTPEGEMKYYTAEEAAALGRYAAEKATREGLTILVTNGPRTGKHNPETGEVTQAHRGEDSPLDPVSQAFMQAAPGAQMFDFKFREQGGVISAYKALLHRVAKTEGSQVLVAGESTSMVSECCDLCPGRVTIFENAAMNDAHHAHVQSVYEKGLAPVLENNSGEMSLSQIDALSAASSASSAVTAAEMVADHISASMFVGQRAGRER